MSTIRVTQNSFNSGEISPLLLARVDQQRYASSCLELKNMLIYPQGSVYRRPGLEYIGRIDSKSRLIPFIFTPEESYLIEFSEYFIRIWYNGKTIPIFIQTPYTSIELDTLQYAQTSDALYITSQYTRAYKLERKSHLEWTFEPLLFGSTLQKSTFMNVEGGTASEKDAFIYVCGVDKENREGKPSQLFHFARSSGTKEAPLSISWGKIDNAVSYHLYARFDGDAHFMLLGKTTETSFTHKGEIYDYIKELGRIRGPYNGFGSFPRTVQLYQQRLIFAGSQCEPQTLWLSKTGEYENLSISSPLQDDDAIIITISSDSVQPIYWLYSYRDKLFIGSGAGEWAIFSTSGHALTPTTIAVERHTAHGSCTIPPARIGDAMIFVQRDSKIVRQLQYRAEYDGFIGNDLSIFSEHITRNNGIRAWAWQQFPTSTLWCLLSDSSLVALTFVQEYNVFAWHKHETEGFIESICTVPSIDMDTIYLSIKRVINGEEVRSLERFYTPNPYPDVTKSSFLDCSTYYEGTPRNSLSSLFHLEGHLVDVVADGTFVNKQIVTNGLVFLDFYAKSICVGLGYSSKLTPIIRYLPENTGLLSDGRSYSSVVARIHTINSPFFSIKSEKSEIPVAPGFFQLNGIFGENINEGSRVHTIPIPYQAENDLSICIEQNTPLPLTILAVTVDITYA